MPKSVIYRSLIIVTKSSLVNTFPWICGYRNKKPPCCDFSGEDGAQNFLRNEADILLALKEQAKQIAGVKVHDLFESRIYLITDKDDSLAKKKAIHVDDLVGLPLFCSGQGWEKDISLWAKDKMDKLHLEGSFRLAYNASVFAREHLGYLLTFDRLVDTSPESGLIFRPLSPVLVTKLYLVWKKYQAFSPIAERFLKQIQASLAVNK